MTETTEINTTESENAENTNSESGGIESSNQEAEAPLAQVGEKTVAAPSYTSLPTLDRPYRAGSSTATSASQKDVSVATVVRLMGLPTTNEFRLLEQKVDTLLTRITAMSQKLDRIAGNIQSSSDVDSVQVQISDVKRLVKELMAMFDAK